MAEFYSEAEYELDCGRAALAFAALLQRPVDEHRLNPQGQMREDERAFCRIEGALHHNVWLKTVNFAMESSYPPVPTIIGCEVGAGDPVSGSTVMANALASTPVGSGGLITCALPRAFGLKRPAEIGVPLVGISHNSYVFCGGIAGILLARNTSTPVLGT